jgi:hypothetical protein
MRQIEVDLSERRLELNGCGYALDASLPIAVDTEHYSAKYSAKRSQLKIKMQEAK